MLFYRRLTINKHLRLHHLNNVYICVNDFYFYYRDGVYRKAAIDDHPDYAEVNLYKYLKLMRILRK